MRRLSADSERRGRMARRPQGKVTAGRESGGRPHNPWRMGSLGQTGPRHTGRQQRKKLLTRNPG